MIRLNVCLFWKKEGFYMNHDSIQRFMFEKSAIRGELVHLDESFHTIMHQHQYPAVMRELLGEALVAVVLLSDTIKFDGQLTLQFQGDGPVSMLVAKCDSKGNIRGYAAWDDEVLPINVPSIFENGQLIVTIEYDKKVKPYQSIIPINRQTVPQALEAYFMQSEQLPTRIYTAVGTEHAAGMLLQVLPSELHSADQEAWVEVVTLADTLTHQELIEIDNQTLLYRLYHEHDLRLFDENSIAFKCRCSVDRMQNAIRTLGEKEAFEVLSTNKEIEVTCEFCNNKFAFDKNQVQDIFSQ
jgi:molecular chaperone Hsp33